MLHEDMRKVSHLQLTSLTKKYTFMTKRILKKIKKALRTHEKRNK